MGSVKMNESEPLKKCRKRNNDVKTGVSPLSQEKQSGKPVAGNAASGMKMA